MTFSDLEKKLRIPVIAAPMFLVSSPELVIAACQAGIVGSYPSLNARTAKDFESVLQTFQEKIDSSSTGQVAPYAINLIVHKTNDRLTSDLELCIQYRVPIVITSLGANTEIVKAIHSYGGLVFHDVIKKRHAQKAAEAGVDALIAVSSGAGGHAGTLHPFALIQELRSVYSGPIILSGGISKGSEILATQALGASLAYLGTRFIASEESSAPIDYKRLVVAATAENIIYTDKVSGVYGSFLEQTLPQALMQRQGKATEDFSSKSKEIKAWKNIWSAGHSVSGIQKIEKVSDIVSKLTEEYALARKRLNLQ